MSNGEILPPGAVGVWPGDAGFVIHEYELLPPERAWQTFTDELGKTARAKLSSRLQDVAVSYSPQLTAPDRYLIEAYIPAENAQLSNTQYHVTYHEGDDQVERVVRVDQAANAGRWVSLGEFDLNPEKPSSGRTNVVDFSEVDPPQSIAFAGIRWRPALAIPEPAPPEPPPEPEPLPPEPVLPPAPEHSHQDVINAFIVAAAGFEEAFTDWITSVGLEHIYADRNATYSGVSILQLSGLSIDRLTSVAHALTLSRAELARAAVEASRPRQPERNADGRSWGVHGSAGFGVPPRHMWDFWIGELKAMGLRWYKQCDNGGDDRGDNSCFRWVLALRDAGITTVIRYQQSEQFPNKLADNYFRKMEAYAREGVIWAEIGNEPNLRWEWSGPWRDRLAFHNQQVISIINEDWLNEAEEALRRGVRPAYPAFAPTDWRQNAHPDLSSVQFYNKSFEFLARHHRQRTRELFRRGAWLAVHVATYELPVDFDPFGQGGATWDMCLRGYEVPLRALQHFLDIRDPVVMSTEGGVFTPESTSMNNHPRLANDDAHADMMLKMFDFIETQTPIQGMMPWCLAVDESIGHKPQEYIRDGWYVKRGGGLQGRAVINRLKQVHRQRIGG